MRLELLIILTLQVSIAFNRDIRVACPVKRNRIGKELEDRYKIVDAQENDTLTIECCQDVGERKIKIWYKQDRFMYTASEEISFADQRIYMTHNLELVIENISLDQAAAYHCRSPWNDLPQDAFIYLVDVLETKHSSLLGGLKELTEYQDKYLLRINKVFNGSDLYLLQQFRITNGIYLQAELEWMPWSKCDPCTKQKIRQGKCRIDPKVFNKESYETDGKSIFIPFHLSCHSKEFYQLFPNLTMMLNATPNYALTAKCTGVCNGFVVPYDKKINTEILLVGDSLTVMCPGDNLEKKVTWRKDSILLAQGEESDANKKAKVDIFSILRLTQVTVEEEGNYTCYLNGKKTQENLIFVREEFSIKYAAFIRHAIYLCYLIFICFIIYVSVNILALIKKATFKRISKQDILEKYEMEDGRGDYDAVEEEDVEEQDEEYQGEEENEDVDDEDN